MDDHSATVRHRRERVRLLTGLAAAVFVALVAEPLLFRSSAEPLKIRARKQAREAAQAPAAASSPVQANPTPKATSNDASANRTVEKTASKTTDVGGLGGSGVAGSGVDASEPNDAGHVLAPALALARESHRSIEAISDYRCLFAKRERFGHRLEQQTMEMLCRHEPFSVYFKFSAPSPGRQVLYVTGQNSGQLLVREAGFKSIVGTMEFPPTHATVMAENHYPITQAGMRSMVETLVTQWEGELALPPGSVKIEKNLKLGDVSCTRITSQHAKPLDGLRFHRTTLYIDNVRKLPIRAEQHAFPVKAGTEPALVEEYTFYRIETNVGLTDADFDRGNRAYGL
jgi:hypothetical protein